MKVLWKLLVNLNHRMINNADTYETLFHDTVAAEIELLREHPSTKHS